MFTFFVWIKALKTGSAFWGAITALSYFYMVSAWGIVFPSFFFLTLGGYVFITNMLPLHAFVLILMGRYSSRLYVAYSTFYAIGTLASMQIPFVGFLPVRTSEHMAALGSRNDSQADYRNIWIDSVDRIYPIRSISRYIQAICSPVKSLRYCCLSHFLRSVNNPDIDRDNRSLDWTVLFSMGYRLC